MAAEKKSIGIAISDKDELQECITSLVDVMRADFGSRFKSQFDDTECLRQYKRRLYAKLRGKSVRIIYDAYESFIETDAIWPPTVTELMGWVNQVEREYARNALEQEKAKHLANLPPPGRVRTHPLKLLAEAKIRADKQFDGKTEGERRMELLRIHHESLARFQDKFLLQPVKTESLCAVPGCTSAGSISNSPKGGGSFYCRRHFRV